LQQQQGQLDLQAWTEIDPRLFVGLTLASAAAAAASRKTAVAVAVAAAAAAAAVVVVVVVVVVAAAVVGLGVGVNPKWILIGDGNSLTLQLPGLTQREAFCPKGPLCA